MTELEYTIKHGDHDYADFFHGIPSRDGIGAQFKKGYFSAKNRSKAYGSGIDLGDGDMACWIGSHDRTGANTAVKFVISAIDLLVLAMGFLPATPRGRGLTTS